MPRGYFIDWINNVNFILARFSQESLSGLAEIIEFKNFTADFFSGFKDSTAHQHSQDVQQISFKYFSSTITFLILTLSTNISPVVRLISNLLFAGLSGSMPCPVRKYTIFCGRSLSPSVAVTCIWNVFYAKNRENIKTLKNSAMIGKCLSNRKWTEKWAKIGGKHHALFI